jgi:hypothetical protein
VVGDWNGDRVSTVGVVQTAPGGLNLLWVLRNSNSPGAPDITPFQYGPAGSTPVTGDWNGDRVTTAGVFVASSANWYLRNSNTAGAPDNAFQFGADANRSKPVTGRYGPGAGLEAAGGARLPEAQAAALSQAALDDTVQAALQRLALAGVSADVLGRLAGASFRVSDLTGSQLGMAVPGAGVVFLDRTAAGHGWFVDATPLQDEEFTPSGLGVLTAGPGTAAAGREDLLTAVLHEMGHLVGRGDDNAAANPGDLMGDQLSDGTRLTRALDRVFSQGNL